MSYSANEQSPTKWQQRSTKFREHLSFISTTSSKKAILKSHWSPSTTAHSATSSPTFTTSSPPPPLPDKMPEHSNPLPEPIKVTAWNRSDNTVDVERDADTVAEREAGPSARPSRFARFSFWKTGTNNSKMSNVSHTNDSASPPPETPASTVSSFIPNRLATWRPLNILKPSRPPFLLPTSTVTNNNTTTHNETRPVHIHTHVDVPKEKRERRKKNKSSGRCWLIILIITLLYLLGNNIFLNIRVQSLTSSTSTNSGSNPGSGASGTSQAVHDCLSQFKLNAPSDPSSYPCATCAAALQTIPNDLSPTTKKTDTTGQGTVLQFCALSNIVSATANQTLQNVGWMKSVDFCGSWSGIQCDTAGRVTSLTLVFPGVPSTLPSSLSSLVGLQTLSITGDGNIPAGSITSSSANASSVLSLSTLRTILFQSTALTGPLPDTIFSTSNLTSVQLVNNAHLGQSLPSSLFALPGLKTLAVNGQGLTQSLASLFSSASSGLKSSLTTLDLSSNSLSGSIPDFSGFTALIELNLGINQFTSLPSSSSENDFPTSLQTFNMARNPTLSGNVPSVVCTDSALTSCDLRSTQLGINGQNATTGMCGPCLFGTA